MEANAKRSISMRIDLSDYAKVKAVASRLRARESDVFRFAIKLAMAKLAPLYDSRMTGADLMPVFVECGTELLNHFNLDARRLDAIINGNLDDEQNRVDIEDIDLLAMSTMPERYLLVRLKEIANGHVDAATAHELLADYLLRKYMPGNDTDARDAGAAG